MPQHRVANQFVGLSGIGWARYRNEGKVMRTREEDKDLLVAGGRASWTRNYTLFGIGNGRRREPFTLKASQIRLPTRLPVLGPSRQQFLTDVAPEGGAVRRGR